MLLLYVPSTTFFSFFFFNDTATTEIYTLSLHDALPISLRPWPMLLQRILPSSSSVPATTCGQPPLSAHGARPIESRSEEHTSELQSRLHLVCRLLLEKKKKQSENTDNLYS